MAIETDVAITERTKNNNPENKYLSLANLEAYIEGCEEVAVRLHETIEKVVESGKRPVILIPSRGAVPIFLLARRILNDLDSEASYLADDNVRYFPENIFDYLEDYHHQPVKDKLTTVDVVLYPFTADVTVEIGDDEKLAKRLRESCARSVLEIVKDTDFKSPDLAWYKFLMRKLSDNQNGEQYLRPAAIIKSLDSFPKTENSQIILIDTVISGRAANDITNAFSVLNHPVAPVLAVDSTKSGKFQAKRKAEIQSTIPWALVAEKGPFVDFPLITEDKGAALLGVVAVNFVNFNKESFFYQNNHRFAPNFLPQSCVWTLPPDVIRKTYLTNFRQFLQTVWQIRQGVINEQQIAKLQASSRELTASHHNPSMAEINAMVPVPAGTEVKETASHIISVKLPQKEADNWVQDFSNQINNKNGNLSK